jgi:hypothetical protein
VDKKAIAKKYREQIEMFGSIFVPNVGTLTREDLEPADKPAKKEADK